MRSVAGEAFAAGGSRPTFPHYSYLCRRRIRWYGRGESKKAHDRSRAVQCREPGTDACHVSRAGRLRVRGYDTGRGVETAHLSLLFPGDRRDRVAVVGRGEGADGASVRCGGGQRSPCGGVARCGSRHGVDRGADHGQSLQRAGGGRRAPGNARAGAGEERADARHGIMDGCRRAPVGGRYPPGTAGAGAPRLFAGLRGRLPQSARVACGVGDAAPLSGAEDALRSFAHLRLPRGTCRHGAEGRRPLLRRTLHGEPHPSR